MTDGAIALEVWDAVSGGNHIQSITLQQSGGAPTNRITSVTSGSTVNYSYDATGTVTNDGVHSHSYDAENRLVSVDGGATAQYKYDHQNRRVTKIVGSAWTHYIWEGAQVIAEHDATTANSTNPPYQVKSARLDYVYAGARMIHSRQRPSSTGPWTTRWFLSDRLSVRITLDNSGNVSGRQAHLPFGEAFGESGTQEKHQFTSYERDSESGLDYAINRYDNVSVGRFLQADPYRASAGAEDPQSWNRYGYARNDPIGVTDRLGLENNPEYCSALYRSCDHIIPQPGFSWFLDTKMPMPWEPGAGPYDGRPISDWRPEGGPPRRSKCGEWASRFNLFGDDKKLAEVVWAEFSGEGEASVREGIAIAFVVKNRLWFLNYPGLTDTLGLGPRRATIEQVLGARGQFSPYKADGTLKPGFQREFDIAWNSPIGSPECDKLINAYTGISGINDGGFRDQFAAQGGGWFFQRASSSPCPICQPLGPIDAHHFWTIPYTDYTGGVTAPWY